MLSYPVWLQAIPILPLLLPSSAPRAVYLEGREQLLQFWVGREAVRSTGSLGSSAGAGNVV